MARHENAPFQRGVSGTGHGSYAGYEYEFEDKYFDSNAPGIRSGNMVRVRVVKNSGAAALLPKTLVTFKAGTNYTEVDGKADTTAEVPCAVVDEWLPSAGAAVSDYFYVVVKGPTIALTSLAGDSENLISEGDKLIALTGATSGATTSGRVYPLATAATTHTAAAELGVFAYALSAKTTANTNADILIYVKGSF